jgi:hypothetical protein
VDYGRNGVYIYEKLGRDMRAHPLRNLVNGSRLNAAVVRAFCWSEPLTKSAIFTLNVTGKVLQRLGLHSLAIATHKAILALAFHLGVKDALGSWQNVLLAARKFTSAPHAPRNPT